jgi:predicted ATPase/class 3 adenylate cyclase
MAVPSGTVTFLFTDIEGSTRLWERHPDAMDRALQRHDELLRSAIESARGHIFKTVGDAFCAAFTSARDAVEAAGATQQALQSETWPEQAPLRVRMALHTGECEERDGDYFGPPVNRTARLEAIAHGGQVVVSQATTVLVRDSLPEGIELVDLGSHRLKDLGRPEQVFQLQRRGLDVDFPPLRSLDNPALANNLPAQSASFIGRDREISEVRDLVEASRLVTLTGAGGAGKTRLALHVAADLLDGSGDGVWLVELAPVSDEEAVASTMMEALGIDNLSGRPALEVLTDVLSPQRVLIVLDNCEHLIGSCAKVGEAILRRCPQVHLMTTSREPLGIAGETIYRVPSLSLPRSEEDTPTSLTEVSDAVALFVDRARTQGVGFTLDDETTALVASICRRLDGMPLAIELAAARLRSLSLASLCDRLDQRFRLLTGGSRNALPRQQTLRATVDWSYSLLNDLEKCVLRRLSVFVEGFDLEAAEAICGLGDIEMFDVTDLLGSLVDKSLVVAEPTGGAIRYRLLETIRQFATERLVESDEQEAAAVAAAHCAHFLALAQLAETHLTGPDQGRWFSRLEADQANLRRAIEHANGEPDGTARVLQFGAALRWYWFARSRREEGFTILVPVLERPEADADPELLCRALVTAALMARSVEIETSVRLGEQAVEIARRLEDDRLLVESLWMLCAASYFAGKAEKGLPFGEESVEHARILGDDVLLGESLAMFLLCSNVIHPERTDELYTEAIACVDRSGDRLLAHVLHNNAGVYALRAQDIPAARSHLEHAERAARDIGAKLHYVPLNLGWVLREENECDSARSKFEDALRISRRNGDSNGMAYAVLGLACLAADLGDWWRSGVLHGVARALLDRTGEPCQTPEETYRLDSIAQVRAHFGEEEFQRAYAQGKGLSSEETVNVAFDGALLGLTEEH